MFRLNELRATCGSNKRQQRSTKIPFELWRSWQKLLQFSAMQSSARRMTRSVLPLRAETSGGGNRGPRLWRCKPSWKWYLRYDNIIYIHICHMSMYSCAMRYMMFLGLHPSISFQYISANACHVCSFVSDSNYCLLELPSKLSGCYCQDHARSAWEVWGLIELPWELWKMWDVWITTRPKWTSCVDPPSLCSTKLLYIGLRPFVAFKTRTKVSANWVLALGWLIWQCVTQSSGLQFAIIGWGRSQSQCYASKLVNSGICDMFIFDDPSSYFPY